MRRAAACMFFAYFPIFHRGGQGARAPPAPCPFSPCPPPAAITPPGPRRLAMAHHFGKEDEEKLVRSARRGKGTRAEAHTTKARLTPTTAPGLRRPSSRRP